MKLYCPHCGVKGVADDSYQGKNVKCPKCQETFIALETVAAEAKEAGGQQVAVATGAATPSEDQASLQTAEDIPNEPTAPIEDATPVEAIEEADEVETARDEVEEVVEAEETVAPSADDTRLEEEQEAVLDWEEIAAEIEAKTVADEQGEAREQEELPAGLFAETAEEEPIREIAGPELMETEESLDKDDLPSREEMTGVVAETVAEQPAEASVEAAKAEEGRENHFIFEEQGRETEPVEVESQPYGLIKEQCWQCGKKNRTGVAFSARGGRLYCPACLPAAEAETAPAAPPLAEQGAGIPPPTEDAGPPVILTEGEKPRLSIGGALREAWEKTKGAKGPILAGSAVMYLTILILAAGTTFLLPGFDQELSADTDMVAEIARFALQALTDAVSVLFTAGLLFMGIRKVAGDPISWKMIFAGFSDTGKIIVATILQSILIFIGFLILVLPGIYLAIGYSMTIPLIVDRKMSPWQAMETSRKAVHQVWWRVLGLYFVMGLIFLVSMVPLGIGLIWTWPMFVILAGVVYHSLFGFEK